MSDNDELPRTLREPGAHYVVGGEGRPVAVLLTPAEYDHYLDLLDDEADNHDEQLAARLAQAAGPSTPDERQSLRDYLLTSSV